MVTLLKVLVIIRSRFWTASYSREVPVEKEKEEKGVNEKRQSLLDRILRKTSRHVPSVELSCETCEL